MSRRWQGLLALSALGLAAAVLIVIELANGALDYGESKVADPCVPRATFPGEGSRTRSSASSSTASTAPPAS